MTSDNIAKQKEVCSYKSVNGN